MSELFDEEESELIVSGFGGDGGGGIAEGRFQSDEPLIERSKQIKDVGFIEILTL
jgi:hypothetical protein